METSDELPTRFPSFLACIDAREDVHGEGLGERWGILYIFPSRAHMSGLVNGGNLTEGGQNGVEDKKV